MKSRQLLDNRVSTFKLVYHINLLIPKYHCSADRTASVEQRTYQWEKMQQRLGKEKTPAERNSRLMRLQGLRLRTISSHFPLLRGFHCPTLILFNNSHRGLLPSASGGSAKITNPPGLHQTHIIFSCVKVHNSLIVYISCFNSTLHLEQNVGQ